MKSSDDFVLTTIAEICQVERSAVTPATSLADIGFDSLMAVSLLSAIEATYGLELDNDALVVLFGAVTPAELIAFLEDARHGRADQPCELPAR